MDSANLEGTFEGRPRKVKHDLHTQNIFRRVVSRAEARGMVVNKAKTKVLCISDSLNYKAAAQFEDAGGAVLQSGESMKVLGFHLDSRPTVHAHVAALKKRMRETKWILRHLKRAGFTESELATVYTCLLYTSPSPRDRQKSRMPSSA